ncbi:hypothetical protein AB0I16_00205 [Streptomyces sp. NPDC050703]|uniref:DUF7848 domain-containing protein n=1 Tax=Streptomyces sp. NPDC050703 TaxID=3157218 RepID=UPI00343394B6
MRARYAFRDYTLCPDTAEESEPIVFGMECKNCGDSSDGSEDPANGTEWAADHLKANPEHLTYREHITRSYRFEPGAWQ